MQFGINFLSSPAVTHGVLGHFKTGNGNTTGIHSLGRCNDGTALTQILNSFCSGGHIGNFYVIFYAVGDDVLSIFQTNLVLSGARHNNVNLNFPRTFACKERYTEFISIILNFITAGSTHFEHKVDLFGGVDTLFIIDITVGTGNGYNLTAEFGYFLNGTPSNVTETGNSKGLTLDIFTKALEQFNSVINCAKTGSFGTNERTAVGQALTGENAGELISQSLILTVQITNFSCTYADITGRNVGISADVFGKFGHKALAETHHFAVTLTARIEVRTALTAAHGQRGQRVLEGLLKAEEFNNRSVYGRMETQAALIRTDGRVELNSETSVYLRFAVIVNPRNTEGDLSFGFYHTLDYACFYQVRSFLNDGFECFQNLGNSLNEFGLAGISLFHSFQNA